MNSRQDDEPLFDQWAERYDAWFATPLGQVVKYYETRLLLDLLAPKPDDCLLDGGCGTGVFTGDVLELGCRVVGVELSAPMLDGACRKYRTGSFTPVLGSLVDLPFADHSFDRVYSMTALEFIEQGAGALAELNRVVRPGGTVVVTTLNRLSIWADIREEKGRQGHDLFSRIRFRTPAELQALAPVPAHLASAIHFPPDCQPHRAHRLEAHGREHRLMNGALLGLVWQRPN